MGHLGDIRDFGMEVALKARRSHCRDRGEAPGRSPEEHYEWRSRGGDADKGGRETKEEENQERG